MFGRGLTLFRLFGFRVRIDWSWIVIAILVAWSLAVGLFPFHYRDLSTGTYWAMGIVGALGLFLSIVAHEFAHSLAARRFGLEMKGITLFLFGGVAEMTNEPPSPRAEFWMAIMGPIASFVLAGLFALSWWIADGRIADPAVGVLGYLAAINALLGGFNLVPAFPLDGGRILRAALWARRGDIRPATRTAARLGGWFGLLLIGLGVFNVLGGNFVGGVWWFLLGLFVRGAAAASWQQLVSRQILSGVAVERFMNDAPVTVPAEVDLRQFVDGYVYTHHHKLFPVVSAAPGDGERLAGCITVGAVTAVPREQWPQRRVGELAVPCGEENTIPPDADAAEALERMRRHGHSRLVVAAGGRVVGVVTLRDLMEYLSLRLELEPTG